MLHAKPHEVMHHMHESVDDAIYEQVAVYDTERPFILQQLSRIAGYAVKFLAAVCEYDLGDKVIRGKIHQVFILVVSLPQRWHCFHLLSNIRSALQQASLIVIVTCTIKLFLIIKYILPHIYPSCTIMEHKNYRGHSPTLVGISAVVFIQLLITLKKYNHKSQVTSESKWG